jgi:hypothetical protein
VRARGAQCASGTNPTNCQAELNIEFDCNLEAGADFSACLNDSQSLSCDALYPDGGLTAPQTCLPPITSTPISDAQTKCYSLVDALCSQSIQCLGKVATSGNVQNCEDDVTTDLQSGLPCLLATAVGPGYASCLAAIPTLACPSAGGGDAGAAMGDAGGGPSMTTIPSCATALTFSP